jgi:hypothetical protein
MKGILLLLAFILIGVVYAETSFNFMTIGQGDYRYCQIVNGCGGNGTSDINQTWVNDTFLRLDTENDPLTGNLTLDEELIMGNDKKIYMGTAGQIWFDLGESGLYFDSGAFGVQTFNAYDTIFTSNMYIRQEDSSAFVIEHEDFSNVFQIDTNNDRGFMFGNYTVTGSLMVNENATINGSFVCTEENTFCTHPSDLGDYIRNDTDVNFNEIMTDDIINISQHTGSSYNAIHATCNLALRIDNTNVGQMSIENHGLGGDIGIRMCLNQTDSCSLFVRRNQDIPGLHFLYGAITNLTLGYNANSAGENPHFIFSGYDGSTTQRAALVMDNDNYFRLKPVTSINGFEVDTHLVATDNITVDNSIRFNSSDWTQAPQIQYNETCINIIFGTSGNGGLHVCEV